MGCGRTFSGHSDTVIPRCTLRTFQLLELVRAVAAGPCVHGAWWASGLAMTVRSAYRWLAKWHRLAAQLRTRLCLVIAPPGKTDGQPDPLTLRHLCCGIPQRALCHRPRSNTSCKCPSRADGDPVDGSRHLNTTFQLRHHQDFKNRVTYSAKIDTLAPPALTACVHRQLDAVGLPHRTFTGEALNLVPRISEGTLRAGKNLCVGSLMEAVRDQTKTVDLKQVNAVLM
jgi:hypothetical protein